MLDRAVVARQDLCAAALDTAPRDRLTRVIHADHVGAHAGLSSVERAAVLGRAAAWAAVAHRGRSARRSIGVARARLGVGVLATRARAGLTRILRATPRLRARRVAGPGEAAARAELSAYVAWPAHGPLPRRALDAATRVHVADSIVAVIARRRAIDLAEAACVRGDVAGAGGRASIGRLPALVIALTFDRRRIRWARCVDPGVTLGVTHQVGAAGLPGWAFAAWAAREVGVELRVKAAGEHERLDSRHEREA